MSETYSVFRKKKGSLCIVLPSLGLSVKKFSRRIKSAGESVCLIYYSGFAESGGTFPGKNIVENVHRTIMKAQNATGKNVDLVIGDSYGGLVALGLLARYNHEYGNVKFILTSPLISFNRLDKDPDSPQSRQGFVRYLKGHKLIRDVDKRQLLALVKHKEIQDPFKIRLGAKNLVIYHYSKDRSLPYSVSEDFSKLKRARIVRLVGDRHALINFEKKAFDAILPRGRN